MNTMSQSIAQVKISFNTRESIKHGVVGLQLFALALCGSYSSMAVSQSAKIYYTPPTAEELGAVLFPPRTRSIVIGREVNDGMAASGIAGMLINFKFGKTDIVPESLPFLDAVGQLLTQDAYKNESIIIEGHTDSVGALAFNQKLSEKRALAVRRYLMSRFDIEVSRLHPVGKGESELHNSDNPRAGVNRRVQFQALDR